ncbi:hypothetical protein [Wolbachia endosymbiont (group A) of Rhinocyllus conicus]|uniref:hypothetical protein n=1 Tax=Wolbachia endosymbiont (group A) of Rhinocyllus conicus TaxID=2954053 RepID=UPI002227E1C5|nr:hypothetical protein [Wolbachia endosymbiont (group A) of Rhinocyllus conicus]
MSSQCPDTGMTRIICTWMTRMKYIWMTTGYIDHIQNYYAYSASFQIFPPLVPQ